MRPLNTNAVCAGEFFLSILMVNYEKKFLTSMDQRVSFQEIVSTAVYEGSVISPWTVCVLSDNEHNILGQLALRFFNCMSKNLVRDNCFRQKYRILKQILG